jgi:APA family basic amino acid/polyamine antiporter
MTVPGLKRVLGLAEVTFIAVGFTIGAGVFVFTGIVARIVGPALPLAYGLAVIPVFISMLPLAMLGAALPTTGGNYRYPSRMVSPGLAFVGIWVYVLSSFFGQIPLYALSCGTYLQAFWPALSPTWVAAGILTFFYVVNLLGIRPAAQVQGIMVVVLILALLTYAVRGWGRFDPGNLHDFFQQGPGNLTLGVALLTFTYLGSNAVIELGGEIRDPDRVIPRAIMLAFPLVTIVYLLVAVATVGAVPWTELAGEEEPLIQVARVTMGKYGVSFFIIGGAILALTTTLNALFMVGTKSLLTIVDDGLLPRILGRINPRFGTAHWLLTLIWLLSLIGVASGFSLETFAAYAALGGMIIFGPILIAVLVLPRRYPEAYRHSRFRLTGFWFWFCPIVGFVMVLFFSLVILVDLKSPLKVVLFLLFILTGLAVYHWRKRYLRQQGVDLDILRYQTDWSGTPTRK